MIGKVRQPSHRMRLAEGFLNDDLERVSYSLLPSGGLLLSEPGSAEVLVSTPMLASLAVVVMAAQSVSMITEGDA